MPTVLLHQVAVKQHSFMQSPLRESFMPSLELAVKESLRSAAATPTGEAGRAMKRATLTGAVVATTSTTVLSLPKLLWMPERGWSKMPEH